MSEKQAAVEAKQEGEFTLKGKNKPKKPKQLGNKEQEITKVSIKEPLVEVEPDIACCFCTSARAVFSAAEA